MGLEGPAGESHPPAGSHVAYSACSAGPCPHIHTLPSPSLGLVGPGQLVKFLVIYNSHSVDLRLPLSGKWSCQGYSLCPIWASLSNGWTEDRCGQLYLGILCQQCL